MHGVGGAEKEFAQDLVGIVIPHRDLAADHVALVFEFILGEGGVADHVTEDFETGHRAARGCVDPVDGAVEGGVGVDVAALGLHRLRDLVRIAAARAFEKHVLEEMRDTRAEPVTLVDAARATPALQAHDRCRGILAHEDLEAVREGLDPDLEGREMQRLRFRAQSSLDFAGWLPRAGGSSSEPVPPRFARTSRVGR